jgi:tRNA (guanine-N7-)-methyltransferase
MGRRSLPKVDPQLDLTGYLLTVDDLPRPWSAAVLFGREAPLEIEVGSGKGLFMASAASAYPQHNFLGIEVAKKYARFAASKLAKRGLMNAKMVAGDALPVFQELLPDNTLAAVHVYFPDPWWKARHKKRRVLNEQFLRNVERVLLPGGTLHFWTDVQEYFETTLALIPIATKLEGPLEVAELAPEHDLDYRTHFERRMRLHGEAVYRSEFRKPNTN